MNEKPAGLDPDEIIERVTSELVALRLDHEQRIGRVLARLHYYARQKAKQRRAQAGGGSP